MFVANLVYGGDCVNSGQIEESYIVHYVVP